MTPRWFRILVTAAGIVIFLSSSVLLLALAGNE